MDPLDNNIVRPQNIPNVQPQKLFKETDIPPQNLPQSDDNPHTQTIFNKSDPPPQPLSFDHLLSTKIQIGPYQYLIALMVCMFPPLPPSNFFSHRPYTHDRWCRNPSYLVFSPGTQN